MQTMTTVATHVFLTLQLPGENRSMLIYNIVVSVIAIVSVVLNIRLIMDNTELADQNEMLRKEREDDG